MLACSRSCATARHELRGHLRQHGRWRGHVRRRARLAPGTATSRRSSTSPTHCWRGGPAYAEYLRLLVERGEFGTENVESRARQRLEDTDAQWSTGAHAADGTVIEVRSNAVPGGGFGADLQRHHRAQTGRGGDPRRARCRRGGAGAADGHGRHPASVISPVRRPTCSRCSKRLPRRRCVSAARPDAIVILREGDEAVVAAHEGAPDSNRSVCVGRLIAIGKSCQAQAMLERPDLSTSPTSPSLDPASSSRQRRRMRGSLSGPRFGVRTLDARRAKRIGCIVLRKAEPGPFTPQQIELLETFRRPGGDRHRERAAVHRIARFCWSA